MSRKVPHRKSSSVGCIALATLACCLAAASPARAEGLWDSLLEKMNVKAAPAAPGPDFVERTRPDPAQLGYIPTALPHKVSPLAVKTTAEIEAKKAALDAAAQRQRDPTPPKPVDLAKPSKPAKGSSAAAVAD